MVRKIYLGIIVLLYLISFCKTKKSVKKKILSRYILLLACFLYGYLRDFLLKIKNKNKMLSYYMMLMFKKFW